MHMNALITVTSQGQITIPVAMRKEMGLDKNNRLEATLVNKELVLTVHRDILSYAGALRHKKKKGRIEDIMKEEQEAIEEGWIEHYRKSQKQ